MIALHQLTDPIGISTHVRPAYLDEPPTTQPSSSAQIEGWKLGCVDKNESSSLEIVTLGNNKNATIPGINLTSSLGSKDGSSDGSTDGCQ